MKFFSETERKNRPDSGLLKLDFDFSISRKGLRIDTVLFDASTDKSRSNSIFTRIFGKLMKFRAKNWVNEYVQKNAFYLPGADNFLKNINSSEGVRRDDFMSLMISAKLSRSILFLRPVGNTHGLSSNHSISNPEGSLINFLVKMLDPSPSKESVKTFFNFIDGKFSTVTRENLDLALEFLDSFKEWSEQNEDNEIFRKMKGSVNIFHSFISKKINFIEIDSKPINLKEAKKINSEEIHIKGAFEVLVDGKDGIGSLLFPGDLRSEMPSSGSEFLKYIKNHSCVINFTNIDDLKKWVETDHKAFIDELPINYQYLIPSLNVVFNQLKIDIKNFESENYKKKLISNFL